MPGRQVEQDCRHISLFEHDLFGKPASTFPDHALINASFFSGGSTMPTKIDPITRSVVQHRLSSIVKEMGEAMLRTTYSQILNSSRDFSLAICDTAGRLIAQADHLPVHVGALPWATLAVEERFKDVKPGDVFLLNDPYFGGSHLPDLTAFVPVFDGDKRL